LSQHTYDPHRNHTYSFVSRNLTQSSADAAGGGTTNPIDAQARVSRPVTHFSALHDWWLCRQGGGSAGGVSTVGVCTRCGQQAAGR